MQQQQQQQYGAPPPSGMAQFGSSAAAPYAHQNPMAAEAAAPISSRPPGPACPNYDMVMAGNFPDDDATAAGDEIERGGVSGNRWPRQETLALLKIRSEMDATFRDATLKGPLWDDVSRKLAELGYMRSAKKCKEKFENVHKYYKRTKEGRAGRQDGKSYRFFTQLEALHSATTTAAAASAGATAPMTNPAVATSVPPPVTPIGAVYAAPQVSMPQQDPVMPLAPMPARAAVPDPTPVAVQPRAPASFSGLGAGLAPGPSFSSDTFSSSSDENEEDGGGSRSRDSRKRKRGGAGLGSGDGGNRKMMAFFEGLMKQVVERQEAMQQRFLETIEKREQDRMIREEAWKRQEMARLNREHELMAQDRAMAASRDAAVISFLQKISGQSIQLPPAVVTIQPPQPPIPQPQQQQPPPPQPLPQPLPQQSKLPPPQPLQQPKQQEHHHLQHQTMEVVRHQPPPSSSTELIPIPASEPRESAGGGFEVGSPSRWPKLEVHALIKLRSGLEMRYQESGPKGPLWEEISAGMQRLGYNRSSKRCKEKWENINKYFKKVKESNKKRPEDAKTCPYFHQLDALYRQKLHISSTTEAAGFAGGQRAQEQQESTHTPNIKPQEQGDTLITMVPPLATQLPHQDGNKKNGDGGGGGGSNPQQMQPSNGGLPSSFFEGGTSSEALKKPEDIVKKLMDHHHQQAPIDHNYNKLGEQESDSMDDDDDDDDEDDEDGDGGKMQYRIQFQRPNVGGGGGDGNTSAKPTTAGAPTTTAGSFLGIVQ